MSSSRGSRGLTPSQEDYKNIMIDTLGILDNGEDRGIGMSSKGLADKYPNQIWSPFINTCIPVEGGEMVYMPLTSEDIDRIRKHSNEIVTTLHEVVSKCLWNGKEKRARKLGCGIGSGAKCPDVWTYVIGYNTVENRFVARFAPVWGMSELTCKHGFLYSRMRKSNTVNVLAAGELRVDGGSKNVRFNILSGTFMASNHSTLGDSNILDYPEDLPGNIDRISLRSMSPEVTSILGRLKKKLSQATPRKGYSTLTEGGNNRLFRTLQLVMIRVLFMDRSPDVDWRWGSIGLKKEDWTITQAPYDDLTSFITKRRFTLDEASQICARANHGIKKDRVSIYLVKGDNDCEIIHRYHEWKLLQGRGTHAKKIFDHFKTLYSGKSTENLCDNTDQSKTRKKSRRRSKITRRSSGSRSSRETDDFQLIGATLNDRWKVTKQCGRGAFGTVYQVRDVSESRGEMYAVKIMPFFVDGKKSTAETHKLLSSQRINIPVPNLNLEYNNLVYTGLFDNMYGEKIVRGNTDWFVKDSAEGVYLKDASRPIDLRMSYLVMPYYKHTLSSVRIPSNGLNGRDVQRFGHSLVTKMQTVCTISMKRISNYLVHNDLKPDNIMFSSDNISDPTPIDWGVATLQAYYRTKSITGFVGTPLWCSPWVFEYTPIVLDDLIAIGFIMCHLLGLNDWKEGGDDLERSNSKKNFITNMSNGDYDQDLRSRDAMFLKEYMSAIKEENKSLVETGTNIDPQIILTQLLGILSEKSVWKSMIRQGTRKVRSLLK